MKKVISIVVALVMFLVLTNIALATDLTSQMTVSGDGLTFSKSYDSEKDVTKVVATVKVTEDNVDTILSQVSGSGSVLADYYFELEPNLDGEAFRKLNNWYGSALTNKTLDEAIASLKVNIANEDIVNYSTVWPLAVMVEYYNGTAWVKSDTAGTGSLSIGDDLANKLGKAESELVYGKDFRFSMYTDYTAVYGWEIVPVDRTTSETNYEFVTVDYKIEFPVSGKNGAEEVYFLSLKEAVDAGMKEIKVNETITLNEDLVVPEGVTITIVDHAKVNVAQDKKITNNGNIEGTVVIGGVEKEYSKVILNATENGTVTVDKTTCLEGDTVTITVKPNEGYVMKKIIINGSTDMKDNEDGTFAVVMKETDLEITVTFEKVETNVEEENKTEQNVVQKEEEKVTEGKKDETPKTGAIPVVAIIAVVSLLGLVFIRKERNDLK